MNEKKLIGITGGIGAGKSLICSIIHAMGYPVFYSDQEAKKIINTNPKVRAQIRSVFGEESYKDDELNRPFISQQIFHNQNLLEAINTIVHPAVREAFADWSKEQSAKLVFNEAAILFETGAYKLYDANILVTAPEKLRVERVMRRDQITAEQVKARISKQWSDSKKEQLADYVIINDDTTMIIPQVIELINTLLK